jgi:hypothetical protein
MCLNQTEASRETMEEVRAVTPPDTDRRFRVTLSSVLDGEEGVAEELVFDAFVPAPAWAGPTAVPAAELSQPVEWEEEVRQRMKKERKKIRLDGELLKERISKMF